MTTAGIPAHALLPLAFVFTGGGALAASLMYRLARATQRRAGWLAVGAPFVPAVLPHLARDDADLAAVVGASVLLFVAVINAQRTRVAQLPLLWGWQVDRAATRLTLQRSRPLIRSGTPDHSNRLRGWLRRWRRIID